MTGIYGPAAARFAQIPWQCCKRKLQLATPSCQGRFPVGRSFPPPLENRPQSGGIQASCWFASPRPGNAASTASARNAGAIRLGIVATVPAGVPTARSNTLLAFQCGS